MIRGILLGLALVFLIGVSVLLVRGYSEAKYTLKPYHGVGSTVYKNGTIVKVEDGKPVVVGRFYIGAEYPGTVQIERKK